MKSIAVFCGSSYGNDKVFEETSFLLGETLALKGIEVVYGGSNVGLMRAVADGALRKNGRVTGVLPVFLQEKEIAHTELTSLILVDTMHERKIKMNEICDGVITLPGGFGSMDELFEMLTWGQLGMHGKPIGILNVNGFYKPLLDQLDIMVRYGLLKPENRNMLLHHEEVDGLLELMENYKAPQVSKWITKTEI